MTERASEPAGRWVPIANLALCTALVIAGFGLLAGGPAGPRSNDLFGGVGGAAMLVMAFSFAGVGAVVSRRARGNAVGAVLGLTGLTTAAGVAAYAYADRDLDGAAAAALLSNLLTPLVAGLLALSLLLFPDGRLPSRRWRPVAVATLVGMAASVVSNGLRPGPFDAPFGVLTNPVGVAGTRAVMNAAMTASWYAMFAGIIGATVATRSRLRGATGVARAQLKWVLVGGAVIGVVVIADMTGWFLWPTGHAQVRMAIIGIGFAIFPVVIGAAILRYRLYDIDVVINRALVYGSLTATLAASYIGGVLLFQLVLSGLTAGSGLAVAASTLATAALVGPTRRRLQAGVDRRFFRERYDAGQTLARFRVRLRDQVDLDTLSDDLCLVAAETMRPVHVSLWLREPSPAPARPSHD